MPGRSGEVIAANYAVRYLFACLGTAVVLPAVEAIGVGWFSTVSTLFLLAGAAAIALTIRYGERWRDRVGAKKAARRKRVLAEKNAASGVGGARADEDLCCRQGGAQPQPQSQPAGPEPEAAQHKKEEV